jgi:hypothetical protein
MKEGRMIGLVRLEPLAACAWVITLESLPPPPALKYSAFMIRCGGRIPVDAVINWFNDLRTQRPDVPIGAVLRAGDASAFSVLRNGIQFTPLIRNTNSLMAGFLRMYSKRSGIMPSKAGFSLYGGLDGTSTIPKLKRWLPPWLRSASPAAVLRP